MKNIIILTDYQLQTKRGAAYSRMRCYQKALGSDDIFTCLSLSQFFTGKAPNEINIENEISFPSFKCKYNGYLYRNFLLLFDFVRPLKIINYVKRNFAKEETCIVLYSSHFFLFLLTLLSLKVFSNYKVIVEKNEIEIGIILNLPLPKSYFIIPFLILYPLKLLFAFFIDILTFFSSTIIVISSRLKKLYRLHPNTIHIPILVDLKRFENLQFNSATPLIKFIYLGTLTKKKDALFEIISAINVKKSFLKNKVEFNFTGDSNSTIKEKLLKSIVKNNLRQCIKLNNPILSSAVPEELAKYDVAILLRSKNLQTNYGLATKLGEYLAAGLPVLTNNISDHKEFLNDGVDSFLVNKITKEEIHKTIEKIINSKEKLPTMKLSAQKTAEKYFGVDKHKKTIIKTFS